MIGSRLLKKDVRCSVKRKKTFKEEALLEVYILTYNKNNSSESRTAGKGNTTKNTTARGLEVPT